MRTLVFKFLFISLLIAGQVEAQVPTRLVLEKTSADETLESMLSEHGLHVRRIMPPFVQQNGRRYMLASSRGAVPPLKSLTLRGRAYSEEDIRTLNNLVRSGGVSELDLREAESDSWDSLCFCGFADDDTVSLQIPLRRIALPRAMKRIPPYFAANLTELGEIIWPASLEEIQDAAFYRDTTLTIAHIPEGVSKIGVGAFAFSEGIDISQYASDGRQMEFPRMPRNKGIKNPSRHTVRPLYVLCRKHSVHGRKIRQSISD